MCERSPAIDQHCERVCLRSSHRRQTEAPKVHFVVSVGTQQPLALIANSSHLNDVHVFHWQTHVDQPHRSRPDPACCGPLQRVIRSVGEFPRPFSHEVAQPILWLLH